MTINRAIALTALAFAVGFAGMSDGALAAKKKVSLEQAWKICKARVDKQYGPNTSESSARNRYALGADCMKEYGYEI